jgi:hypothetical protein
MDNRLGVFSFFLFLTSSSKLGLRCTEEGYLIEFASYAANEYSISLIRVFRSDVVKGIRKREHGASRVAISTPWNIPRLFLNHEYPKMIALDTIPTRGPIPSSSPHPAPQPDATPVYTPCQQHHESRRTVEYDLIPLREQLFILLSTQVVSVSTSISALGGPVRYHCSTVFLLEPHFTGYHTHKQVPLSSSDLINYRDSLCMQVCLFSCG